MKLFQIFLLFLSISVWDGVSHTIEAEAKSNVELRRDESDALESSRGLRGRSGGCSACARRHSVAKATKPPQVHQTKPTPKNQIAKQNAKQAPKKSAPKKQTTNTKRSANTRQPKGTKQVASAARRKGSIPPKSTPSQQG